MKTGLPPLTVVSQSEGILVDPKELSEDLGQIFSPFLIPPIGIRVIPVQNSTPLSEGLQQTPLHIDGRALTRKESTLA